MADADQQPTPQTTGAVMDVQPPKPADNVAVESTPTEEPVAPVEPSPTVESEPAAEEAPSPAESTSEQPAQDNPLAVPLDGTAHHKRKPVGVIIFAIIVAGALAGLTVYAFKSTQPATKPATSTQQTKSVETVTPADVDQTSKDIDADLQKMDDTKDLPTTDLDDATLGL